MKGFRAQDVDATCDLWPPARDEYSISAAVFLAVR